MSRTPIILAEVDVVAPGGGLSTLRFSDTAFRPMAPGEAGVGNVEWDARMMEAPALRRALFEDFANLRPGLGVGVMGLANNDRALDAYRAYVWGEMRVWRWYEGDPFADGVLLFAGPCAPPQYSLSATAPSRVRVGFWDYRAELERPLQATLFLGGNDGSTVLYEGEADGLKGRPRPLAYGALQTAQIPAPQVNGGVYAYRLHDGPIEGPVQTFDRGDDAGLLSGGDFVGGAFDAATPAPAAYVTDLGRGLVKINASPVGEVTFGFKGDKTGGYVETAGPVIARILAKAGVAPARIGASVAALDADAVIGVYDQGGASAADLVAWVAAGAAAAVLPDRTGVWGAAAIAPPAAIADLALVGDQILSLDTDGAGPLPVGEVKIGWGRIWSTTNRNSLAPALWDTAEEARLAVEYRYAVRSNPTVKARRPETWRTLQLDTALRSEADAIALADSLLILFGLRSDGSPREQFKVVVELTDEALAIQLGQTVSLPPEYAADLNLLLIGEDVLRPRSDRVTWTLWG